MLFTTRRCSSTLQPKRAAAWEELQDTINKVTEARNLIVCGDFIAAIHHRKGDEDDLIGQHVLGKGRQFLATKAERTPQNFTDNREHLVTLARITNTVIANTYIEKNLGNEIIYKATDNGPPWTPDRYYEIDHRLVRKCWRNSVLDIAIRTNMQTYIDHYMMTVTRQALKSKDEIKTDPSLKNVSILEGNEEDILKCVRTKIILKNQ